MSVIPADFKMPNFDRADTWGKTSMGSDPYAPGAILRPTAGSIGPMYVEFAEVSEYVGAESEETGVETYRKKEVLHVKTDRFSTVPLAVGKPGVRQDKAVLEKSIEHISNLDGVSEEVKKATIATLRRSGVAAGAIRSELSQEQQRSLAPLYERFKEQKGSTDTHINQWQAVSDGDRAFLGSLGIFTIEQLYHTPEEKRHQFGPGGQELWERSQRFMKAKLKEQDNEDRRAELALIREERERMAKRENEMQEQMFKMQAQIAELSKGKAKSKEA